MPYTLKKTLRKIIKKQHNFVAQVKGNQKGLLKWLEFNSSVSKPIDKHSTYDHNTHGRYEDRSIEIYDDLYQIDKDWNMVKRFAKVTATIVKFGKVTTETRWYISNLEESAETFLHIIRSHWKIENSLHYVKDVAYQEDFDRTRTKQIPYVKTTLRNYAINLQSINKITNKTQSRKLFAWGLRDVFSLKSS
jgi:predicted transposase YbfD/YdcC